MGIFVSNKDILRCPECGDTYFKSDGFTKCIDDGCDLISEDEYEAQGYPKVECPYCHSTNTQKINYISWLGMVGKQFHCNSCDANF